MNKLYNKMNEWKGKIDWRSFTKGIVAFLLAGDLEWIALQNKENLDRFSSHPYKFSGSEFVNGVSRRSPQMASMLPFEWRKRAAESLHADMVKAAELSKARFKVDERTSVRTPGVRQKEISRRALVIYKGEEPTTQVYNTTDSYNFISKNSGDSLNPFDTKDGIHTLTDSKDVEYSAKTILVWDGQSRDWVPYTVTTITKVVNVEKNEPKNKNDEPTVSLEKTLKFSQGEYITPLIPGTERHAKNLEDGEVYRGKDSNGKDISFKVNERAQAYQIYNEETKKYGGFLSRIEGDCIINSQRKNLIDPKYNRQNMPVDLDRVRRANASIEDMLRPKKVIVQEVRNNNGWTKIDYINDTFNKFVNYATLGLVNFS